MRKDCPDWLGPGVEAVARVRLVPEASRQVFEKELGAIPAVLSAWHLTGDVDYEIRLRCRDLAALGATVRDLRRCRGAATVSADLMLAEVPGLPGCPAVSVARNGSVDHGAVDHGAGDPGADDHGADDHGSGDHGSGDHGAGDHGAAGPRMEML